MEDGISDVTNTVVFLFFYMSGLGSFLLSKEANAASFSNEVIVLPIQIVGWGWLGTQQRVNGVRSLRRYRSMECGLVTCSTLVIVVLDSKTM